MSSRYSTKTFQRSVTRAGEVEVVRRVAVHGRREEQRRAAVGVDALARAARDLLDQPHVGVDRQVVAVVLERRRRDHDDDVVARARARRARARCAARSGDAACAVIPPGRGTSRPPSDRLRRSGVARRPRRRSARARAGSAGGSGSRSGSRSRRAARPQRIARAAGARLDARGDREQRLRVRVLRVARAPARSCRSRRCARGT